MPATITAHFNTLPRAVKEARKYGCTKRFEAIEQDVRLAGRFIHDITSSRRLIISRAVGRKRWRLAVDVSGRVTPVASVPIEIAALLHTESA